MAYCIYINGKEVLRFEGDQETATQQFKSYFNSNPIVATKFYNTIKAENKEVDVVKNSDVTITEDIKEVENRVIVNTEHPVFTGESVKTSIEVKETDQVLETEESKELQKTSFQQTTKATETNQKFVGNNKEAKILKSNNYSVHTDPEGGGDYFYADGNRFTVLDTISNPVGYINEPHKSTFQAVGYAVSKKISEYVVNNIKTGSQEEIANLVKKATSTVLSTVEQLYTDNKNKKSNGVVTLEKSFAKLNKFFGFDNNSKATSFIASQYVEFFNALYDNNLRLSPFTYVNAIKSGDNTYNIQSFGDANYSIVDKDGNIRVTKRLSSNVRTTSYSARISTKKDSTDIKVQNPQDFTEETVTLNEGETLILSSDIIETEENLLNAYNNYKQGLPVHFKQDEKVKQDDAATIFIDYSAPETKQTPTITTNNDGVLKADGKDIIFFSTNKPYEPRDITNILTLKEDNKLTKEMKEFIGELQQATEISVPAEYVSQVEELLGVNKEQQAQPKGTINVYWGQAESPTSTRILSNLAPRKFIWEGKEYGSVEHAYQSNKSGSFDKATYDKYAKAGGYGKKIRGKSVQQGFDNLKLIKELVVESFKQNPNSEAAKKLLQYENFTHNTNELIDQAFLEGLKIAQQELLGVKSQASSFQGYKGGFDSKGKGTPQGDGKDKAMREIADVFVVEVTNASSSSSITSLKKGSIIEQIKSLGNTEADDRISARSAKNIEDLGTTVMLARNGSLKNKALHETTKDMIKLYHEDFNMEFIVGDMPNVDTQFIEYLQEIGAKFTVYHTGDKSRINVEKLLGAEETQSYSNTEPAFTGNISSNTENKVIIDTKDGDSIEKEFQKQDSKKQPILSKYELFPGVFANQDQKEAIDKFESFIKDEIQVNGQSNFALLKGRGGTGKTTIIKKIIDLLPKKEALGVQLPPKVMYIAPTHKAKNVLSQSTGIEAVTLASALGIKLNETTGIFEPNEYVRTRNKKMGLPEVPLQGYKYIVIDESSMVSDKLFNGYTNNKGIYIKGIKDFIQPDAKIFLMGDNTQLPPVGQDKDSVAFEYTLAELNERMRQNEDSPILPLSDIVAKNVESDNIQRNSNFQRETKFNKETNTGVIFEKDQNILFEMWKKDFESNPENTKLITFNNQEHNSPQSVKNLNAKAREIIRGKNAPEFMEGDILTAYNTLLPDPQMPPIVENSVDYTVVSLKPVIKNIVVNASSRAKGNRSENLGDVSGYEIVLKNNITGEIAAGGSSVFIPTFKEKQRLKQREKYFYTTGKDPQMGIKIAEQYGDIEYGYAITSHKSQGSTYRNVYVMEDNILGNTMGSNKSVNQSLYVSFSRPSDKLVVLSNKNETNPDLVIENPSQESNLDKYNQTEDNFLSENEIIELVNSVGLENIQSISLPESIKNKIENSLNNKNQKQSIDIQNELNIEEISADYGVRKAETNLTEQETEEFIELLRPQAETQTFKENQGKNANMMFHYGYRWGRRNGNHDVGIPPMKEPLNNNPADGGRYYGYDKYDQNGNPLPPLSDLQPIIDKMEQALGEDMSDYDSVIANIYLPGEYIYPHRDTTESKSAKKYGVKVMVLGNDAALGIWDNNKGKITFANTYDSRYAPDNLKNTNPTNEIVTTNGTIYEFGNQGRGRFNLVHTTPDVSNKPVKFPPITLPNGKIITNYTITLTFRRAADLISGIPTAPAKITTTQPSNNIKIGVKKLTNKQVKEKLRKIVKDKLPIELQGKDADKFENIIKILTKVNEDIILSDSELNDLQNEFVDFITNSNIRKSINTLKKRRNNTNNYYNNITGNKIGELEYGTVYSKDGDEGLVTIQNGDNYSLVRLDGKGYIIATADEVNATDNKANVVTLSFQSEDGEQVDLMYFKYDGKYYRKSSNGLVKANDKAVSRIKKVLDSKSNTYVSNDNISETFTEKSEVEDTKSEELTDEKRQMAFESGLANIEEEQQNIEDVQRGYDEATFDLSKNLFFKSKKADFKVLSELAKRLNKETGVQINLLNSKELAELNLPVDVKVTRGFVNENEIYINTDLASTADLYHEYAHVWLSLLKATDENAYNEIIAIGLEHPELDKLRIAISNNYGEMSEDRFAEEVFVTALSEIMGRQSTKPSYYNKIWNTIKKFINKFLSTFNLGKLPEINAEILFSSSLNSLLFEYGDKMLKTTVKDLKKNNNILFLQSLGVDYNGLTEKEINKVVELHKQKVCK